MDKKLYFATIKTATGAHPFCEEETRTGLCGADHEHVYHVEDGDPSELDPDAQSVLAAQFSRQEAPYGTDHTAPVTNIWDAKSVRGRQWPPK
ncbi:hypothetical protein UFOVP111_135 [uncultured Caudovirales phage]|uniref:Uncharacterized protein n=1 Tax=uncultured Caudovirales phage TaxID=2100421 RepID=A0A6J5L3B6_9CAUD|nr:hypothetical protein UFOVP111_135 [uncultured Caudovirales phage]